MSPPDFPQVMKIVSNIVKLTSNDMAFYFSDPVQYKEKNEKLRSLRETRKVEL